MNIAVVALVFAALAVAASAANVRVTIDPVVRMDLNSGLINEEWAQAARVPASEQVEVVIAVKQKNVKEAEALLDAISTPGSGKYGQQLTHEQVGELTRDEQALATVRSWLQNAAGVRFNENVNGDWIVASGAASAMESLLNAEFFHFKSQQGDRKGATIRRTMSYELPAEVAASVDFIARTTDFPMRLNPRFHASVVRYDENNRMIGAVQPKTAGDVWPEVLWNYYKTPGVPSQVNAKSTSSVFETIGQAYSPLDLSTFEKDYGVKGTVAKVVGPNPSIECLLNPNDCVEATLDVEYLLSIAQNIPLTYWSIPGSDQTPFVDWAAALLNSTTPPLVNSISYGGDEKMVSQSLADRFDAEIVKLGLQGVSVFVASGDDGVAGSGARSNPSKCGFNPSWPATAPHVTAVGATQGPEAVPAKPEVVCSSKTGGGITSGGGFSTRYGRPSWQDAAVDAYMKSGVPLPPSGAYNASGRGYPDVSALGHAYEIYVDNQIGVGSGTSASTPVWAGFVTLVNNMRLNAGKKPLGFLNPAIYQVAAKNANGAFRDVTSGENNCCAGANPVCCQNGFTATKAWDPLSGWGSIDFPAFAKAFAAL
eukprot:TRINITY_DN5672_c0_g1_i1.p1 TRINITY_DN5672_c0_g1~~TRINITY_DN5672_c0_g1_i1.p1  ORF type:complete len:595 (-),score=320.97 TRINITY_DN5672_c0_g1_i1:213-1997(-)